MLRLSNQIVSNLIRQLVLYSDTLKTYHIWYILSVYYLEVLHMPKRIDWQELEQKHGELQVAIPKLLNKTGSQKDTAKKLGIAPSTLGYWLKQNKFKRKMQWVQESAS